MISAMTGRAGSFTPTSRDEMILKDVWLYRYLQTRQIARLHFGGNIKIAQRRMRKLYEAGMVRRFRSDAALRAGFRTWVYRLARRGAEVLSGILGEPARDLMPPTRPPNSMRHLDHHRDLTDFRIWLREGCVASDGRFGYKFIPGYEEIRGGGARRRRIALNLPEIRTSLIPDGAFTLDSEDGRSALFLLEIDRGTEPLTGRHPSSIEKKFFSYNQAFDGFAERLYERLFESEFRGFRILCLVPDEKRRAGFLRLAEMTDVKPLVWVGLSPLVESPGDLEAPLWLFSADEEPRALTE